jgi:hypothetical protein
MAWRAASGWSVKRYNGQRCLLRADSQWPSGPLIQQLL